MTDEEEWEYMDWAERFAWWGGDEIDEEDWWCLQVTERP